MKLLAREPIRLRSPAHPVHPRARWWWTLRAVALVVPLLAAAVVATFVVPGAAWLRPLLPVAGLLAMAYLVVMPLWRYQVHRWEVTEQAVYAATGWVVREWRISPISRIQTVDTRRGPLEQLLGLAAVAVTTASAHGTVYIVGLDHETAQRTADRLTEITEATPGDAT
ncbi:PH domain-containing protein [Natronosporangium hydrolyticum]|uniref:PH domain-containing protein n=1 Tax=Natronosporangium hydrolyticum TaxID=2811111 RepID=A0A895YDT1_9ACTN|nr:PH domain-containing protein [Natronosporangium hydrolyticum]QSB12706.1 PH domain-containing protein [Natronosporangium hydrolyticum]